MKKGDKVIRTEDLDFFGFERNKVYTVASHLASGSITLEETVGYGGRVFEPGTGFREDNFEVTTIEVGDKVRRTGYFEIEPFIPERLYVVTSVTSNSVTLKDFELGVFDKSLFELMEKGNSKVSDQSVYVDLQFFREAWETAPADVKDQIRANVDAFELKTTASFINKMHEQFKNCHVWKKKLEDAFPAQLLKEDKYVIKKDTFNHVINSYLRQFCIQAGMGEADIQLLGKYGDGEDIFRGLYLAKGHTIDWIFEEVTDGYKLVPINPQKL